MNLTRLGGLLRNARKGLKLPLRAVAKRLDVSIPYLSRVELGRQKIRPELLRRLATILRLDHDETTALFVARGRLPPVLERRLLRDPSTWGNDW